MQLTALIRVTKYTYVYATHGMPQNYEQNMELRLQNGVHGHTEMHGGLQFFAAGKVSAV